MRLTENAIFELDLLQETPCGLLGQVLLPSKKGDVPQSALSQLLEPERRHASTLHGFRLLEFVGGRIAFRAAAKQLGVDAPLLPGLNGMPNAPDKLTVSISHKADRAVALVALRAAGTVGVDLENGARERLSIAPRVLRPEELAHFEALPEARKWRHLQQVFALKEATYKAIFPHVQRFVSFDEASVNLSVEDVPRIVLHLKAAAPQPLQLEAWLKPLPDGVMAFVRARST